MLNMPLSGFIKLQCSGLQTSRAHAVLHMHPLHALICMQTDTAAAAVLREVYGMMSYWMFT